jgi:hypothetical protein
MNKPRPVSSHAFTHAHVEAYNFTITHDLMYLEILNCILACRHLDAAVTERQFCTVLKAAGKLVACHLVVMTSRLPPLVRLPGVVRRHKNVTKLTDVGLKKQEISYLK